MPDLALIWQLSAERGEIRAWVNPPTNPSQNQSFNGSWIPEEPEPGLFDDFSWLLPSISVPHCGGLARILIQQSFRWWLFVIVGRLPQWWRQFRRTLRESVESFSENWWSCQTIACREQFASVAQRSYRPLLASDDVRQRLPRLCPGVTRLLLGRGRRRCRHHQPSGVRATPGTPSSSTTPDEQRLQWRRRQTTFLLLHLGHPLSERHSSPGNSPPRLQLELAVRREPAQFAGQTGRRQSWSDVTCRHECRNECRHQDGQEFGPQVRHRPNPRRRCQAQGWTHSRWVGQCMHDRRYRK